MSFNPNIPQPGDNLSTSQGQMLVNFTQLNEQYSADHDGFDTIESTGLHNQVTFTETQTAPSLSSGVSGIYSNLSNSLAQLFFQNSTQNFQITGIPLVSTTPSASGFGITTASGLIVNF